MNNPVDERLNRWLNKDITLTFIDDNKSYTVRKELKQELLHQKYGPAGPAFYYLSLEDDERQHLSFGLTYVVEGLILVCGIIARHHWCYAPDMYSLAYNLAGELASIVSAKSNIMLAELGASRWHKNFLEESGWKPAFSYSYTETYDECTEPCHLHECNPSSVTIARQYYMKPVPEYGIHIAGWPVHDKTSEWYS